MREYKKLLKEYSKEVHEVLTELENLNSFKERFKLIQSRTDLFKPLSKGGSSRLVYEILPTQTVLKLAYKEAGLAQNKIECDYILKDSIFPSVIDFMEDENGGVIFLECQKADKVKKSEFKNLIGLTFDEWCIVIDDIVERRGSKFSRYSQSISSELQSKLDLLYNQDDSFLVNFERTLGNYDFLAGDLKKINSYGKINGQLVIIDYGLTEDIYDEFYIRVKKGGKKLK